MPTNQTNIKVKILVTASFLVMVTINALANTIPINGVTTGEVSTMYKNLFTPASITFSIWGLIYILLAGYVIYQWGFFQSGNSIYTSCLLEKVGIYFTISSVANVLWILAWHYFLIALSMLLMIIILVCLILISSKIRNETGYIKFTFGIYFGWITIATIANVTTLLVSIGFDGFGISEVAWTVIILIVGLVIAAATILTNRDIAYGLAIIWAYIGILIQHTSAKGFDGRYLAVIVTAIICIVLLSIAAVHVFLANKKDKKLFG